MSVYTFSILLRPLVIFLLYVVACLIAGAILHFIPPGKVRDFLLTRDDKFD